ncbi:MAG: hypothetical protein VXY93_17205, partial [Pseudomonadota bacterium]|nr:hypothetical protein [Pseudomonadota bacterium]
DGVVGLATMMRMYPYRQQLCVNGETTAQVDQVGLGITGNIYHLNDWNSNYSAFDTYFGFPGNNTFHLFTSDTRKLYITSNQLILENLSQGVTINSNVDLNGDIDVDGHTNLDNVSIAGVSTITGMSNHSSRIQMLAGNAVRFLNAGNSASTEIKCDGGARLNITSYNQTMATFENGQSTIFYTNNGQNRLQIANDGNVTIAKELQAGSKIVAYDSTSTSNQV